MDSSLFNATLNDSKVDHLDRSITSWVYEIHLIRNLYRLKGNQNDVLIFSLVVLFLLKRLKYMDRPDCVFYSVLAHEQNICIVLCPGPSWKAHSYLYH